MSNIDIQAKSTTTNFIAESFFDPSCPTEGARIEFSEKYFAQSDEERILTMIHEFIHVKYFIGVLSVWLSKSKDACNKLDQRIKERVSHVDQNAPDRLDVCAHLFPNLLDWLHEIWAELYLKNEHSDLFPKRIEHLYKIRKREYDKYTGFTGYGQHIKYPLFLELVRATYLWKIAGAGTDAGKRFDELRQGWRKRLQAVAENEMDEFTKLEDELTDISTYPDSAPLESSYLSFAIKMVS